METRLDFDNRSIIYKSMNGRGCYDRITVEAIIENGKITKSYELLETDDFYFGCDAINFTDREILFEYDNNHPLYIPFKNLLNDDKELIIDDDFTRDMEKKYVHIKDLEDKITLSFINELEDSDSDIEKFGIHVINIFDDGRSKIDHQGKDTKKRLLHFFNEIDSVMKEKNNNQKQKILNKK